MKIDDLRTALCASVTRNNFDEVVYALLDKAKKGNVDAAKLMFDRLFGPAIQEDLLVRMEQIEEALHLDNPDLKLA